MTRGVTSSAFWLVLGCGYHDTAVATYRPPIAVETGGASGSGAVAESGQPPVAEAGRESGGAAGATTTPACWDRYTTVVEGLTSRYKVVPPGLPWPAAELDCEADGAHLVLVDDAAEQTYLTSVATQMTTDNGSTNELVWIGLSDQSVEGSFVWVTGAPLSLTHWSSGEPNNSFGGIEDCAEIRSSGAWNDDHCSAKLAYVCECDGAPSLSTWCDTDLPATCGDCSTSCSESESCVGQKCE